MTQQHPIAPPPELVEQWLREEYERGLTADHTATRAAQWGADIELEACCELLQQKDVPAWSLLRMHRRPKPPSLKEQALEDLDSLIADLANHGMGFKATNIRRALEQLPE